MSSCTSGGDCTVVGPTSASSHFKSVVIDRVQRCVQYELTGLIVYMC